MAGPTVAEAILGVEIKGVGDIAKQLEQGFKTGSKQLDVAAAKAGKTFSQTMKEAGDHLYGTRAMKNFQRLGQELMQATKKAALLHSEMRKKGLKVEEKERIRGLLTEEKSRISSLSKRLKMESEAIKKIDKRRTAVRKALGGAAQKTAEATTDSLASGMESAFEKMKNLRLDDLIRAPGAAAGKGGKGAFGKGFQMKKDIQAGKMAASMGKLATSLQVVGVALGAFAAVAGAVALLVKLFIDLDSRAKEFNKELSESTGLMDLTFERGYKGGKEFAEMLETVRTAAHDTNNNLKWMTMPKEQLSILKAFNEAGYRIKDMTEGLGSAEKQMQKLQDVTSVALTYSRLLGVSTDEVAGSMGTLMSETGLGLEEVTEGFGKVARIAQQSGFNVKRFYSTVLEATSGMTYYNIKIEEAAHLLDTFTKILGRKPGMEMFKAMQEGFAEMGYKERVKQIMVTGGKEVRKILSAESEKASQRFWGDFVEGKAVKGALQDVGSQFGINVSGGKDLAQGLSKLSEKEYTKLVSELRHGHGIQGETLMELDRIRALTKGSAGSLGDQAKALDDMSETGVLAMKMTSIMGKGLHEYSLTQLMGFEETKGISGKQLKTLQNMSREFHGAYGALQEMGKDSKTYGVASGTALESLDKKQQSLLKMYGATVDEDGKIRKASIDQVKGTVELGEEIENLQEFIVKQNGVAEAAAEMEEEMLTKDQILAQQVVSNTEGLSKIIDITIAGWLERIYQIMKPVGDILLQMLSIMPGGDEVVGMVQAQKDQQDEIEMAAAAIMEAKQALPEFGERRQRLEKMLAKAEGEGESGESWAKGIKEQLEELNQQEKNLKATIESEEQRKTLARTTTVEDFASGDYREKSLEQSKAFWQRGKGQGAEKMGAMETAKFMEDNKKSIDYFAKYYEEDAEKKDDLAEKAISQEANLADAQKKRDDDLKEKIPTDEEIASAMTAEQKKSQQEFILSALGVSESRISRLSASQRRRLAQRKLGSDKFKSLDPYTQQELSKMAIHGGLKAPKVGAVDAAEDQAEPVEDFIVTDSGRVLKPSANDTIIGMKPGGPLDRASGAQISITINESHNTEKTYSTVKRALRDGGLI